MLQVAGVAREILLCWDGVEEVDQQAVITTCLIHDVANILKFDLEASLDPLDPAERDLARWTSVQNHYRETYGDNEHEAVLKIAAEYRFSEEVQTLLGLLPGWAEDSISPADPLFIEMMLCVYADGRVMPQGVAPVAERFDDLLDRYQGKDHILANAEYIEAGRDRAVRYEHALQALTTTDITLIDTTMADKHAEWLLELSLM
ncbi:MAG: hypothetical protein H6774_02485 [Pseudomonadales bacterium]|nr:hypothetical protein [Pseudomonadales bacterium]